ncbi:MAG: hypothetical protein ACOCZV_02660 [Nanoarchaeota archaeon]
MHTMVRITIDTAQDDASTIQSVITILHQELSRKTRASQGQPAYPVSENSMTSSSGDTSAGGAFQHQDTSNLMNMFSDDMPSTDPQTYHKHSTGHDPSTTTSASDTDFGFGNVEDVAGNGNTPSVSDSSQDDDDDDVIEYH